MADPRHVPATADPGHCVCCQAAPGIQPRAWGRVCIFCDSAVAAGHLPIGRPAPDLVLRLWVLISEVQRLLGVPAARRACAGPRATAPGGDHV